MQHVIMTSSLTDHEILTTLQLCNKQIFLNPSKITSTLFITTYDQVHIYCSRATNELDKNGEEIYFMLKDDLTNHFNTFQYENISSLKKQILGVNVLALILKKIYSYLELHYIPICMELKKLEIMPIDTLVYERFYAIYLNNQCKELFIENNLIKFTKFLLIKINNEKRFINMCNEFIISKREETFSCTKLSEMILKANSHLNIFEDFFDYDLKTKISKKYMRYFTDRADEIVNFLFKSLKENNLYEAHGCYRLLDLCETGIGLNKWLLYIQLHIKKHSTALDFIVFSIIVREVFRDKKEFHEILQNEFRGCVFDKHVVLKILNTIYLSDTVFTLNEILSPQRVPPFISIKPDIVINNKNIEYFNDYKPTKHYNTEDSKPSIHYNNTIVSFLESIFTDLSSNFIHLKQALCPDKKGLQDDNSRYIKNIMSINDTKLLFIIETIAKYTNATLNNKQDLLLELLTGLLNDNLNFISTYSFIFKLNQLNDLTELNEFSELTALRAINDLTQIYRMRVFNVKVCLRLLNSILWENILEPNTVLHPKYIEILNIIKKEFIKYKIQVLLKIIESNSLTIISINGKRLKTNALIGSIILLINDNNYTVNRVNEISIIMGIESTVLNEIIESLKNNNIIFIGDEDIIYISDSFKDDMYLIYNKKTKEELEIKKVDLFLGPQIMKVMKRYKKVNKIELFERVKRVVGKSLVVKKVFVSECEKLVESGYLKETDYDYCYIP